MAVQKVGSSGRLPATHVDTEVAPILVQVLLIRITGARAGEEVADRTSVTRSQVTVGPEPLRSHRGIARVTQWDINEYLDVSLIPTRGDWKVLDQKPACVLTIENNPTVATGDVLAFC